MRSQNRQKCILSTFDDVWLLVFLLSVEFSHRLIRAFLEYLGSCVAVRNIVSYQEIVEFCNLDCIFRCLELKILAFFFMKLSIFPRKLQILKL